MIDLDPSMLNQQLKAFIQGFTFLSRDALHIYGGLIFYLAWRLIFRNKYRMLPLFIIAAFTLINEGFDLHYYHEKLGYYRYTAGLADFFNTLFVPVVLHLSLNFQRTGNRFIPDSILARPRSREEIRELP